MIIDPSSEMDIFFKYMDSGSEDVPMNILWDKEENR